MRHWFGDGEVWRGLEFFRMTNQLGMARMGIGRAAVWQGSAWSFLLPNQHGEDWRGMARCGAASAGLGVF